jgi:hypothetical protein
MKTTTCFNAFLVCMLTSVSLLGCRIPSEHNISDKGFRTQCDFSYRNQPPQNKNTAPQQPTQKINLNDTAKRRIVAIQNHIVDKKKQ